MIDLNVTLDARNVAKFRRLRGVSARMAAQSLTFTAERAVPAWRDGHSVFHRRNSWIDKGVRLRAATAGNLVAKVGSIDRYMSRHVKGAGEPKRGRLFVPMYDDIDEVPTHTRMRSKLRRMHATKRPAFWFQRGGVRYLARRKGKKRTPLELLGRMQNNAAIRPELDAVGIVERTTRTHFPRIYERLLLKWANSP